MCLSPRLVKNKSRLNLYGKREFIQVGCGHCSECIAQKKESLLQRNFLEFEFVKRFCPDGYSFWSTLTFDNEHLTATFCYKVVSDFIKRLRRKLEYNGFDCSFKYFYVSELGDTTLRPHYHIAFYIHYGVPFDVFEQYVRECWQQGFTDTSYWHRQHILTDVRGIRYLIKYLNKEYGIEQGDNITTSYRCSKNLGYYPEIFDYTQDIVIPSANGNQNHHIGSFFLNKLCYEYRTDSEGHKLKTLNGSYIRGISEFGIDWKMSHLDIILDKFHNELFKRYQRLDDFKKVSFDYILGSRSFRQFSDYCYYFSGRVLGKDNFIFDLSKPKDFLREILQLNRQMRRMSIDYQTSVESLDSRFENFDLLLSYLSDIDYKSIKDNIEIDKQQSVNRLKKFLKNV